MFFHFLVCLFVCLFVCFWKFGTFGQLCNVYVILPFPEKFPSSIAQPAGISRIFGQMESTSLEALLQEAILLATCNAMMTTAFFQRKTYPDLTNKRQRQLKLNANR